MRLLLDTHVWLWQASEPERLGAEALGTLKDPGNELHVSVASVWEIAVKASSGKLALPAPPLAYVPRTLRRTGASTLHIETAHALRVADLPLHHRDPFDRLLVAQAQVEGLTLVTADPQVQRYDVDLLAA